MLVFWTFFFQNAPMLAKITLCFTLNFFFLKLSSYLLHLYKCP